MVHLNHALPYVRRLRTAGWINPSLHCDCFSSTHPRDFVIMTILNWIRPIKFGFRQTLTSVLRLTLQTHASLGTSRSRWPSASFLALFSLDSRDGFWILRLVNGYSAVALYTAPSFQNSL